MRKKISIHNLTYKITDAHPYGYCGSLIKGVKGAGKSTYCEHVSAQVYYLLSKLPDDKRYIKLEQNITLEEAYHVALDHTKFKLKDIMELLFRLKGALRNPIKMCPVIIWDDAGIYAGSSLYWEDKKQEGLVRKYNNVIRTRCTGWLINTPMVEGLTKSLRHSDDPVITITDHSGRKNIDNQDRDKTINKYRRYATAVKKKQRSRWDKTIFVDDFRCRFPFKSVHNRYIDMKEDAFEDTEEGLKTLEI